jgi:hypothetical protein
MNFEPTLTAQEFKTIHNALCDLDNLCQTLEEVLNSELLLKLVVARNNIRKSLENAYTQENEVFDKKSNHFQSVQQELGLHANWSIYNEVNNLADRHPFEGADRVVYENHWGGKSVSCGIIGSTWTSLYVAANACIRDSGDDHHVFIECFRTANDDPHTLILSTGS